MTTPDHLSWRTSTYTGDGENCVEVAPTGDGVLLRDTKDRGRGAVIRLDFDQWADFLRGATRMRPTSATGIVSISEGPLPIRYHGATVLTNWHVHCRETGSTLHFTPDEWSAFLSGVRNDEFDLQKEHQLLESPVSSGPVR